METAAAVRAAVERLVKDGSVPENEPWREIHQRAPHAKVFVLGYPTVLSRPFNQPNCY